METGLVMHWGTRGRRCTFDTPGARGMQGTVVALGRQGTKVVERGASRS
jgi:hypothetical protein